MPQRLWPWSTAVLPTDPWHLSTDGLVGDRVKDKNRPQVIARSLVRFRHVPWRDLAAHDRQLHLQVQLDAWAPFANTGYALVDGRSGCAVFAWDADAVAERARAAGGAAPASLWPETLLQARPASAEPELRLQACREGYEGQYWLGGELQASRWWPQLPDAAAWQNFQRGCSLPDTLRQADLPAPATWQPATGPVQPWATPRTPQAMREQRRLRWHGVAAGLSLLLALPTAWLLVQGLHDRSALDSLQAELATLRADMQPVMRLRADAQAGSEALQTLVSLYDRGEPLALLAHLSERVEAAGGATLRELDWDAERLRIVLATPAAQPRIAYVQALEEGGWLSGVREDTQDTEAGTLALVAQWRNGPWAPGRTSQALGSTATPAAPAAATAAATSTATTRQP